MKKKSGIVVLLLGAVIALACCSCGGREVEMTDIGAVTAEDIWSPVRSYVGAGFIHCGTDGDDRVYELHARDGSFLREDGELTADLTVEGSGGVYWEYFPASGSSQTPWDGTRTFLDILIRDGGQYVGYAVVAVERPESSYVYTPTVIACQETRLAEGVSRELLQQMIDDAIEKA